VKYQAQRNIELVNELLKHPENECIEYKQNNIKPDVIGKLCSALSNSARMQNQNFAYIVWGVDDNGEIVGTDFTADDKTIQKFKLAQKLTPKINCRFEEINHPLGRLVLLEIPATTMTPIEFDSVAYIRIGSATPKLTDHIDKMQLLIKKLQSYTWEKGIAKQFLTADEVLNHLNYQEYFKLTQQVLPQNNQEILKYLERDRIIEKDVGDKWNVLNLGAIILANNLNDFDVSLARKSVRFIVYSGKDKTTNVIHRIEGNKGYAMAIGGVVNYINKILPTSEVIGEIYRETTTTFPTIAIREIIANALIHQDMSITGAGPQVELFNNRLEVTNPGESLNPADRMIDLPPRSRNEGLANLMRRMRLCEEQGSGVDKIITSVESAKMPAPEFRIYDKSTQVILYAFRPFADLTTDERVRACYQHAVIKYTVGEKLKNSSLCKRFGIKKGNESQVSRVIKIALEKKLIKIADDHIPRSGYYPYWV
jgi:predicted HTH transcriptional regulator